MKTEKDQNAKGGGMFKKLKALAKRVTTMTVGTVLVLSQCLGTFGAAFGPSVAYAAGDETITGQCSIVCTNALPASQSASVTALFDVTMPDGKVYKGHCINPGDAIPADGTYSFTGTRNGNGSYSVTVNSRYYFSSLSQIHPTQAANYIGVPYGWAQAVGGITYSPNVDVTFSKTTANAKITSGNSEYSYAGAEYDIYRASDNSLACHIVTDGNGNASYKLAPNEKYYAIETKAPQGFQKHEGRIEFTTGNAAGNEQLVDDPGTVRISVAKKDSATLGDAQNGATLEGAEFKCTSLSTPGWEATGKTDKNGNLKFIQVPFGQVQVVETKAPTGYKLDSTVHTYYISRDQMTASGEVELEPEDDFKENPQAFDVEIAKTQGGEDQSWDNDNGQGNPAVGVQFQIISNTTGKVVGTLTTNESGFASTKDAATVNAEAVAEDKTDDATRPWFGEGKRNAGIDGALPYDEGGYTIHEVDSTVPAGYDHVDDWTISADEQVNGVTKQYSVIDKTITGRLQIVKVDSETGATVAKAGFTFQILDKDGKVIEFDDPYDVNAKVKTFTTDSNGQVSLPERLKSGKYFVQEVEATAPYLLNGEKTEFEVSKNYKDATPVAVVKMSDKQVMGTATITKTCSEDGKALQGAEFDVIAQGDITSPDGTVHAVDGTVVDHVVTDENGKATTKELYLGDGSATYAFVETKAPAGHVLDTTPIKFTLSYKDMHTDVVTTSVDVKDAPTRYIVNKTIANSGNPLAGAKFAIWNVADEIAASFKDGTTAAVRADEGKKVTLKETVANATVKIGKDDTSSYVLKDKDGQETDLSTDVVAIKPGKYTVVATDKDGEKIKASDAEITIEKDKAYTVSIEGTLLGQVVKLSNDGEVARTFDLKWSASDSAYETTTVAPGKYQVLVDGNSVGSITLEQGKCAYASVKDNKVTSEPMLLKSGKKMTSGTTDMKGRLKITHLTAGSYRMVETSAPSGYIESDEVYTFTIDANGMTEGKAEYEQSVVDDYTKVHISKRDITNEAEIEGAKLTLKDSAGKVVDSWTSTTEDHVLEALAPGKYTLTEEMTPHTYDEAETIEFTVEKTGEVQSVSMHDTPIKIEGEIDKRQEIADPTHPYTEANGDGENKAETSVSEDGSYDYTLDFRSTSNTWTDEFTVEDDLYGVMTGKATLEGITTPQAYKDFDGKMNVWYKTDQTPEDYVDESGANATLSDGHSNPWLTDESNAEVLGEDGRKIDYTGWKLWKADVSTDAAEDLNVSDLDLADGEHVTAIRFEYGRVEKGFTTRDNDDAWNRDDIKDSHDDIADADESAKDNGIRKGTVTILVDVDGKNKFQTFGWDADLKHNDDTYSYEENGETYALKVAKDGSAKLTITDKDGKKTEKDLKASQVKITEENDFTYAPAIVHMKVTDDYRADDALENYAKVDLYRNGGGEDSLEDHDEDKVKQTPTSTAAIIGTTLTGEDGQHTVKVGEKVELTDTVSYSDIEVGVEHTVTGTLMDKTTGAPISDTDGNPLVSTTTFTPDTKDGTAEVKFTVDTTHLDGHELVAFETLTVKETETDAETGEKTEVDKTIAEHKDINDEGQTVKVVSDETALAQTGRNILFGALAALTIAAVAGGVYVYRKRHMSGDTE